MTQLYLVRHGETRWERERRIKGQLDVPLASWGREQAAAVAEYFRDRSATMVYCSTLRRSRQTAQCIANILGVPLLATPLLDERNWGLWQGFTEQDVARERASGRINAVGFAPLGEGAAPFAERVGWFLDLILTGGRHQTVVAVTHGGVLKNILLHVVGLPVTNRSALAADTGSISLVEHDGWHWRPVFLNCKP
ncbi:MAG: histidine phosphatase family protein [Candidatus Zipacnadales bacterium]